MRPPASARDTTSSSKSPASRLVNIQSQAVKRLTFGRPRCRTCHKSPDEVLQLYPTLRREDVTAVVAYAAELAGERDRDEAARRLGQAFGKLDVLNDPPMSPEEVQTEIEGARAERRAWMQRAAPKDSTPDDR